ncbi:MAG: zinc metallopeptidase [Rhodospirillum sp.]|nr:zinc metallopeptidase [Rhodospirillum sp.]MCF8502137.1 zinc metallopeptidase [Rhodospirillum sp.]
MRWRDGRRSDNVEDRRGEAPRFGRTARVGGSRGNGLLGLLLSGRFGKVGLLVGVGLVVASFLGFDFGGILGGVDPARAPSSGRQAQSSAAEDDLAAFVSVVLADTEGTWRAVFQRMGGTYKEPRLVLFRESVRSACGMAGSAMGPFYCPADQKVYIDLSFYQELRDRHGAPGDFAQAYVIAHEVGHHVQTLLGISAKVHEWGARLSKAEINGLSVRQELQADCFAGLWAHSADADRSLLDAGDIDEALRAASAIGDDRLQRESRGTVTPDSFTHGTSEQRVRWFKKGFTEGRLDACDTFSVTNP